MPAPPTSNPGNFVILALSVWGAIADWRYLSRGGKPIARGTGKRFLIATVVFVLLLAISAFRGVDAGFLGTITGLVFLFSFAAWELYRFFVRKANPIPKYK